MSIQGTTWGRVDHRWQGLRNALAGIFCASLGSLDEQRTTSPVLTFRPEGLLPNWTLPHQLRHATLPAEHVCTENLTPFLKLLPCKSLSGIASLLNPHRLFDADWHGMGVHVLLDPSQSVKVRLTFQSVSDPMRYSVGSRRGRKFPVHFFSYDLTSGKLDWSFSSIFDRRVERSCPIAQSSYIRVELPDNDSYTLSPEPIKTESDFAIFNFFNSKLQPLSPLQLPNTPRRVRAT